MSLNWVPPPHTNGNGMSLNWVQKIELKKAEANFKGAWCQLKRDGDILLNDQSAVYKKWEEKMGDCYSEFELEHPELFPPKVDLTKEEEEEYQEKQRKTEFKMRESRLARREAELHKLQRDWNDLAEMKDAVEKSTEKLMVLQKLLDEDEADLKAWEEELTQREENLFKQLPDLSSEGKGKGKGKGKETQGGSVEDQTDEGEGKGAQGGEDQPDEDDLQEELLCAGRT